LDKERNNNRIERTKVNKQTKVIKLRGILAFATFNFKRVCKKQRQLVSDERW